MNEEIFVQAGSSWIVLPPAMSERGVQTCKVWVGSLRNETRSSRVFDWLELEGFASEEIVKVWVHTSPPGCDSYAFIDCASEEV